MTSSKGMTFKRYGRSFHMLIETASDLRAVLQLDQAHWVATNAPISTINCDKTFLSLLDTDHNGRITCQEVKQAIEWLLAVLSDYQGITAGQRALAVADLDPDHPQAQQISRAVGKMLTRLGQTPDAKITLEQVIEKDVENHGDYVNHDEDPLEMGNSSRKTACRCRLPFGVLWILWVFGP